MTISRKRSLRLDYTLSIVLIGFLTFLAYGLFTPRLGFYWDDWPLLWIVNAQGVAGIFPYTVIDRPILAIPYAIGYIIANNNAFLWQLMGLGLRFAASVAFLWMVRSVWSERRLATLMMAVLFTVYPGFLQQPIALIYIVHSLALISVALSIGCTVHALQSKTRIGFIIFTLIAIVTELYYLSTLEFYIGSEVLRFTLIGIIIWRRELRLRQKTVYILRHWLPYFVMMCGFLVWRFLFFTSERSATNVGELASQYQSNFLSSILRIPLTLINDFFDTTFFAWFAPTNDRLSNASSATLALTIVVGAIAIGAYLGLHWWTQRNRLDADENQIVETKYDAIYLLLFVGVVLASLLPVIISGRQVVLLTSLSRYSLPVLMSVCIVVTFGLYLMRPILRISLVCILIASSIGTHVPNANIYRAEWQVTQDLWWQLSWRIPDLAPETVLIVSYPTGSMAGRTAYTVWGPANIIYTAPSESDKLIAGFALDTEVSDNLHQGSFSTGGGLRTVKFDVNYKSSLVVTVPWDNSCLRVIDNLHTEFPNDASALVQSVAPYSRLDRIRESGETNKTSLTSLFGKETSPSWCYYFEHADLARQFGEWEKVVKAYDEAQSGGFAPQDVGEWLPFLEAFINLGDAQRVNQILEDASTDVTASFAMREMYCGTLDRLRGTMGEQTNKIDLIKAAAVKLTCVAAK